MLPDAGREIMREYGRKYRAANSEKRREYMRKYNVDNREKEQARKREYQATNAEKISVRMRAYRAANPEKDRERSHKWRTENPEKNRESKRMSQAANPEASRAAKQRRRASIKTSVAGSPTAKQLAALMKEPCVYCGAPSEHIDHVIPLARGGAHDIDNLVPACAKCNTSKGAKLPVIEWKGRKVNK